MCASLVLGCIAVSLHSAKVIVNVGDFSGKDLSGWNEKSFSGATDYRFERQAELNYLYASADKSASALYKKIKIDLRKTPYLNWSWRVDKPLPELNEQVKEGDDYSARVYVIVKRGLAPWRTNALNYIWSSNKAPEQSWPNAFTEKAIMIPLRTRLDASQEWRHEKVNVRTDFEDNFGVKTEMIDGVAIMVDSDNSGLVTAASFGDIYFSAN